MITLTTDKGLVRIESWDDIVTRPGFTIDIDPKSVKLQAIIGSYAFADYINCGLATCHQPHGKGYLVSTQDGRETNIGGVCGRTFFSVDFEQMRRTFDRDYAAMQRREHLWSLRHRLPNVIDEIASIKSGSHGATWMQLQIAQLIGTTGALPRSITKAVADAARSNGTLVGQRELTKAERETRSAATDITGLDRRGPIEQFVSESVGQLDGYTALSSENSLRSILVQNLDPFIRALADADIDSLSNKELSALYRESSDFDALLDRLRSVVVSGRRLLRQENLKQLTYFAKNPSEKRVLNAFLTGLPTGD